MRLLAVTGLALAAIAVAPALALAAPTVTVASPAPGSLAHGSVQVTVNVVGGGTTDKVRLLVDGAATGTTLTAAPYVFTLRANNFADGTHTLAASDTPKGGTETDSAPINVIVDNTAPTTAIVSPTAGNEFLTTLPVQATAADANGIQSVQFAIDGTAAGSAITSPTSPGGSTYSTTLSVAGLAAGTHKLTETATDAAGNTAKSASVNFSTASAPPSISIATPVSGSFARGTVSVTSTVAGGVGNDSVQYLVDGVASGSAVKQSPYTYKWATTGLTAGTHTLSATVTDSKGATGTASPVTVTVDNTPPATAIASPAASLSFTGTMPVTASATDASGIQSVQFLIDGKAVGSPLLTPDSPGGSTYSSSLSLAGLANGSHKLTDTAIDNAGNTSTSAAVTFTVVPPPLTAATITAPTNFTYATKTVTVSATPTGGTTPYTAKLLVDGVASTLKATVTSTTVSFAWVSTTVADGTHTLAVSITDAKKVTVTSSPVTVTVDNTPPTTYLIAPLVTTYTPATTIAVSAHASDAYGVKSVQYLIDGVAAGSALTTADAGSGGYTYSTTLSLAALAPGAHTVSEVATDNAGNTATTPAVTLYVAVTPLTAAITSPTNYGFIGKTGTVTATITGGLAPYTVTLLVDGVATTLVPTISGGTASFAWDSTTVADGVHTLSVTVVDSEKQSLTSAISYVAVDNTPPEAVMYEPVPLAGYTYARTNGPTPVQVHASDTYGVASVQFTVDGAPVGSPVTTPDSGTYLYTSSIDTSTLAPGMHTISAIVTDNAGNTTTAAPLSLKSGPIVYVPVINWHGITGPLDEEPDVYDQTPAEATAELSYLQTNGYQSITLAQYETWLSTGALPAGITKPILLTVDDGLTDELAWDPLLQQYGFTAVLFEVTGFADNTAPGANDPIGNMSWAQVQALAANGRWTIAFHAGEYGHSDYSDPTTTIDLGGGQVQSYSTTCFEYYNCLGTITTTTTTGTGATAVTTTTTAPETPAQFESQVTAEVTAGMAELKAEVPTADMTAWACPWNACGQWTNFYNDPSGTLQTWMPAYFASVFPIVFTQTDPITYGLASGTVYPLNAENRHYRFEVLTSTTTAQFAAALTDPAFANN
jgi:hypothetical protein